MCSLVIIAVHRQEVNVKRTDFPKNTTTYSIKHFSQKKILAEASSYAIERLQGIPNIHLNTKESLYQHLNQSPLWPKIKSKFPHLSHDQPRNLFHLSNELLLLKDQVPLTHRNGNFVLGIEMSIIRYRR
jgi:hypothetical protein